MKNAFVALVFGALACSTAFASETTPGGFVETQTPAQPFVDTQTPEQPFVETQTPPIQISLLQHARYALFGDYDLPPWTISDSFQACVYTQVKRTSDDSVVAMNSKKGSLEFRSRLPHIYNDQKGNRIFENDVYNQITIRFFFNQIALRRFWEVQSHVTYEGKNGAWFFVSSKEYKNTNDPKLKEPQNEHRSFLWVYIADFNYKTLLWAWRELENAGCKTGVDAP